MIDDVSIYKDVLLNIPFVAIVLLVSDACSYAIILFHHFLFGSSFLSNESFPIMFGISLIYGIGFAIPSMFLFKYYEDKSEDAE